MSGISLSTEDPTLTMNANPRFTLDLFIDLTLTMMMDDGETDLIRHGKHARAPAAQPSAPVVSSEPHSSAFTSSTTSKQRDKQQRAAEDQANQAEFKGKASPAPVASGVWDGTSPADVVSPHKEIAEFIVKEERAAKNKMPIYPGLENFELLEKMGE